MTLLPIHIVAGLTAIVAGFVAVYALKGAELHRKSGMIFVYSMWVLSLTGAMIAALKQQPASVIGGTLAFYLVITALLTVRRREHGFRWIDAGAFVVAVAVGGFAIKIGLDALNSVTGKTKGVPAAMLFFFATVALLGAIGDMRVMLSGQLQGAQRIARHLWRMCFALFVASGSFFLGQAQVFPKPIRIYPLLAIPALLPLVLLLYWLVRVLFTRWYQRRADSFADATARRHMRTRPVTALRAKGGSMEKPRAFADTYTGSRGRIWLGVILLALGFLGHFFAARAIGGSYVAFRDHILGFFMILLVTGAIVAGVGWRFWRGRHDITVLIIGAVQALFGLVIYIERFNIA